VLLSRKIGKDLVIEIMNGVIQRSENDTIMKVLRRRDVMCRQ